MWRTTEDRVQMFEACARTISYSEMLPFAGERSHVEFFEVKVGHIVEFKCLQIEKAFKNGSIVLNVLQW